MARKNSIITIAGCGPGSPDYITPRARKAALTAEVLIGADRLLCLFPGSKAERIAVKADMKDILDQIAVRLGKKRIVVLVTGDPGICSLAQLVIKRFGRDACEIIPGISSVQLAFAMIGREWSGVRIIDAHGADPCIDMEPLKAESCLAVLAGRPRSIGWIREFVKNLGRDRSIYVCENLSLKNGSVRKVGLQELDGMTVASQTIVLIVKEA